MENSTIKNLVKFNPKVDVLTVKIESVGQYDHLFRCSDRTFVNNIVGYLNYHEVDVYLTGEVIENPLFKKNKPYYYIDIFAVGENRSLEIIAEDLIRRNRENISVEETTKYSIPHCEDCLLVDKQFKIRNKELIYIINNNLIENLVYINLVQKSNFKD